MQTQGAAGGPGTLLRHWSSSQSKSSSGSASSRAGQSPGVFRRTASIEKETFTSNPVQAVGAGIGALRRPVAAGAQLGRDGVAASAARGVAGRLRATPLYVRDATERLDTLQFSSSNPARDADERSARGELPRSGPRTLVQAGRGRQLLAASRQSGRQGVRGRGRGRFGVQPGGSDGRGRGRAAALPGSIQSPEQQGRTLPQVVRLPGIVERDDSRGTPK